MLPRELSLATWEVFVLNNDDLFAGIICGFGATINGLLLVTTNVLLTLTADEADV